MCEIPIVKNNDEIIKYKKRSEILENDIYRVSSLWITNSSGEVLLAKRAKIKKNHPGVWGPAVSGTVEKDETYYENILKETNEEIGLDVDFVKENISELKKDFVN